MNLFGFKRVISTMGSFSDMTELIKEMRRSLYSSAPKKILNAKSTLGFKIDMLILFCNYPYNSMRKSKIKEFFEFEVFLTSMHFDCLFSESLMCARVEYSSSEIKRFLYFFA